MSSDPPQRRAPVPASVAALAAATRAYSDALRDFCAERDHTDLMRRQLREFSVVPLLLMASRPPWPAVELFSELVLNLCQGSAAGMPLARNIIRTLPKSEVERRVAADLESLVKGMAADEIAHLADLLIELGLATAVARVAAYAASRSDAEMGQLADDLDGVEQDESRWRMSKTERIFG